MMVTMNAELGSAMARVRELVDEHRAQCLWFLRPEYCPTTVEDACQALDYIQRYGDRDAFRRAGALKQWLSRISSAASVA
jgi:hypothetical protein